MDELYSMMSNIDINPDDTSSDEEDFEDALMEQPTLKSKILLDGNPRRVIVRLDENLCQILPFKCKKFFKTFIY